MPRRFSNLFFRRKKPYRPEDDTNLEVTPDYRRRLAALYGVLLACILIFAAALYNAQVVNGADYYATSASRIAQEEDVEASRGVITDRNGKLLVSNRQVYTVTFDEDALEAGEDENAAILRLLSLLEDYGIAWEDTLPLSAAPVRYSFTGSGTQRSHFQAFLEDLGWSEKELEETIRLYEKYIPSNNPVLNAILAEKALFCERHQVTLSCAVGDVDLSFLSVPDLSILLGNAIDNAVEGAARLADPGDRVVSLSIQRRYAFLSIQTNNRCLQTPELHGGLPRTTKAPGGLHGYGLKSIRYIASKYGGNAQISVADRIFTLQIMLPIPSEKLADITKKQADF